MENTERPKGINVGGRELALPSFFPSVSSVKTALSPLAYVQTLNSFQSGGQFLFSAYDLIRTERANPYMLAERAVAKREGTLVLLDSGNYEAYWQAPTPEWTVEEFHEALRTFQPDLAFGFDDQAPPTDAEEHLKGLLKQFAADCAACPNALVIPIVHGAPSTLPNVCARLASEGRIQYLAVPERCLGSTLLERVRSVGEIRRALNKECHSYVSLHVLGTGNPLSLALMSHAGADTFDGLEWCQVCVDGHTQFLHHFSHAEFFVPSDLYEGLSFPLRTLAHNLEFFGQWMQKLRIAVHERRVRDLVEAIYSERISERCDASGIWESACE